MPSLLFHSRDFMPPRRHYDWYATRRIVHFQHCLYDLSHQSINLN